MTIASSPSGSSLLLERGWSRADGTSWCWSADGSEAVARVAGKESLRASSEDFLVKKTGIEFRVAGPEDGEVCFDNLQVWGRQ